MDSSITKIVSNSQNIGQVFDKIRDSTGGNTFHSIQEMKQLKNTKVKGDLFEHLCKLYLLWTNKYLEVWLLSQLPDTVRKELRLLGRDMGIDLVCKNKDNSYSCVQCKFKTPSKYKPTTVVGWKELSTFYALADRTGPWSKYIVMTNANYVKRMGMKSEKDVSICIGTWESLSKQDLHEIAFGKTKMVTKYVQQPNIESLREARLKRFE